MFSFPVDGFSQPWNTLWKLSQPWTLLQYLDKLQLLVPLTLSESKDQEIPYLISNHVCSRVSVMVLFVFFCSSIACSFFMSILKNSLNSKIKPVVGVFLGKVVGIQHTNLLKWKPKISVFLGITDITCWDIFRNSYYIEPLNIIETLCVFTWVSFRNILISCILLSSFITCLCSIYILKVKF